MRATMTRVQDLINECDKLVREKNHLMQQINIQHEKFALLEAEHARLWNQMSQESKRAQDTVNTVTRLLALVEQKYNPLMLVPNPGLSERDYNALTGQTRERPEMAQWDESISVEDESTRPLNIPATGKTIQFKHEPEEECDPKE